MRNILRFLKGSEPIVIGIVIILIVQAYCDLSLPKYTSDIISLYREGKNVTELKTMYSDLDITINNEDDSDYAMVTIKKNLKLITPGFNRIFGNPYKIKVERYILNEQ